jgi:hypothetical protein
MDNGEDSGKKMTLINFFQNIMSHWIYLRPLQKIIFSFGIFFLVIIGLLTLTEIFNESLGRR